MIFQNKMKLTKYIMLLFIWVIGLYKVTLIVQIPYLKSFLESNSLQIRNCNNFPPFF